MVLPSGIHFAETSTSKILIETKFFDLADHLHLFPCRQQSSEIVSIYHNLLLLPKIANIVPPPLKQPKDCFIDPGISDDFRPQQLESTCHRVVRKAKTTPNASESNLCPAMVAALQGPHCPFFARINHKMETGDEHSQGYGDEMVPATKDK